jgi:hypothetical protein
MGFSNPVTHKTIYLVFLCEPHEPPYRYPSQSKLQIFGFFVILCGLQSLLLQVYLFCCEYKIKRCLSGFISWVPFLRKINYNIVYGFICHLVFEGDFFSIYHDLLNSFRRRSETKNDKSVFFSTHKVTLWPFQPVLLATFSLVCTWIFLWVAACGKAFSWIF